MEQLRDDRRGSESSTLSDLGTITSGTRKHSPKPMEAKPHAGAFIDIPGLMLLLLLLLVSCCVPTANFEFFSVVEYYLQYHLNDVNIIIMGSITHLLNPDITLSLFDHDL